MWASTPTHPIVGNAVLSVPVCGMHQCIPYKNLEFYKIFANFGIKTRVRNFFSTIFRVLECMMHL